MIIDVLVVAALGVALLACGYATKFQDKKKVAPRGATRI